MTPGARALSAVWETSVILGTGREAPSTPVSCQEGWGEWEQLGISRASFPPWVRAPQANANERLNSHALGSFIYVSALERGWGGKQAGVGS